MVSRIFSNIQANPVDPRAQFVPCDGGRFEVYSKPFAHNGRYYRTCLTMGPTHAGQLKRLSKPTFEVRYGTGFRESLIRFFHYLRGIFKPDLAGKDGWYPSLMPQRGIIKDEQISGCEGMASEILPYEDNLAKSATAFEGNKPYSDFKELIKGDINDLESLTKDLNAISRYADFLEQQPHNLFPNFLKVLLLRTEELAYDLASNDNGLRDRLDEPLEKLTRLAERYYPNRIDFFPSSSAIHSKLLEENLVSERDDRLLHILTKIRFGEQVECSQDEINELETIFDRKLVKVTAPEERTKFESSYFKFIRKLTGPRTQNFNEGIEERREVLSDLGSAFDRYFASLRLKPMKLHGDLFMKMRPSNNPYYFNYRALAEGTYEPII